MCTLLIILFTLVTLVSFKKGFLFKLQIKIVPRAVGISISSHTHTLYDFNQAFLCQITPEFDVSPSQGYHSDCQGQVSELHKIIENWKTLMILGLITLSHSSPPLPNRQRSLFQIFGDAMLTGRTERTIFVGFRPTTQVIC